MDTLSAAQRATLVVATLLLGGCDLGMGEKGEEGGGEEKGEEEGEGGESAESGETEGELPACDEHESDEDGDGICDTQDLCNEAEGTHCFEMGIEMPAMMSQHPITDGGRFGPLLNADLRFGATLEIEALAETGPCNGEMGAEAKAFMMQVVEVNAVSTNPDAQAYLDAELLTEFRAEGVLPAARFIANGEDKAQLQIALMAGLPPGHVFLLIDGYTYSPDCAEATVTTVIEGTGGLFRIDHATAEGVSDRIEGARADYRLYPIGG